MTKRVNEIGRTIIEMLGVLVIIGILTIGGTTGYKVLIARHKKQEAVKIASEYVVNVRTSDVIKKRHGIVPKWEQSRSV